MNPNVIRENLEKHLGERVKVQIFGMRNKNETFVGNISEIYPQIFRVTSSNGTKTFSYSDIINGEVILSFL